MWKFWKKKKPPSVNAAFADNSYSFEEVCGASNVKRELYLHVSDCQAKNLPFRSVDIEALIFVHYGYRPHLGAYKIKGAKQCGLYFTIRACSVLETKVRGEFRDVVFTMEDDSYGTRTRLTVLASELPQVLEPLQIDMHQLQGGHKPLVYPAPGIHHRQKNPPKH